MEEAPAGEVRGYRCISVGGNDTQLTAAVRARSRRAEENDERCFTLAANPPTPGMEERPPESHTREGQRVDDRSVTFVKKLLLITDFFRPDPGGLEGFFTAVARAWDASSVEVIVSGGNPLVEDQARAAFDRAEPYRVVRRIPRPSILFWRSGREYREFIQTHIQESRPDHILFGGLSGGSIWALPSSVAESKIPHSVFLSGGDLSNRLAFTNFKERRLLSTAKIVFVPSRTAARMVRDEGIPDERIALVPPGFLPSKVRKKIPVGLEARIVGKIVLLGVGPFLPRKGMDVAVLAMKEISARYPNVHLVLVGSGPESGYLSELIRVHGLENAVTMTGFIRDDEYAGVLAKTGILLKPGREREDDAGTLGTTLMEAAWSGIPVIAGRVAGSEEVVRTGFSGILVPPGRVEALVEAVASLVQADDLRLRMGKNAREMARREFDLDRTCAAVISRI